MDPCIDTGSRSCVCNSVVYGVCVGVGGAGVGRGLNRSQSVRFTLMVNLQSSRHGFSLRGRRRVGGGGDFCFLMRCSTLPSAGCEVCRPFPHRSLYTWSGGTH